MRYFISSASLPSCPLSTCLFPLHVWAVHLTVYVLPLLAASFSSPLRLLGATHSPSCCEADRGQKMEAYQSPPVLWGFFKSSGNQIDLSALNVCLCVCPIICYLAGSRCALNLRWDLFTSRRQTLQRGCNSDRSAGGGRKTHQEMGEMYKRKWARCFSEWDVVPIWCPSHCCDT